MDLCPTYMAIAETFAIIRNRLDGRDLDLDSEKTLVSLN
jgi:hypothetical protein